MPTIYDVARAAGVTAATVSNVVTGKGAVSARTRERVRRIMDEMGYRPNMLARSLATRQTCTIALILPNIANPFYPEFALEVEHTARRQGYSVFLCNTRNDDDTGRDYLQQLASRRVDGVIVMPGGVGLEDLAAATGSGLPVVLCNWEEQDELPALPMVGVDFFAAGHLAAAHLLALGHRRIGMVADASVPHTRHTERAAGFVSTLAAAGIAWDRTLLHAADSSIAGGYAAIEALMRRPDPPTALFCTNDLMAIGALEAALAHAIAVPDRLSIIGVDDISISAYTHPPLTTISIPKSRIAADATALLLRWLAGDTPPAEAHLLPPALIDRRSTKVAGPGLVVEAPSHGSDYRSLLDPPPS